MKELITMWKNTRMIVLTAVTAAVYAAVLIPFKVGIPLIPGFTEVRPANVIPIICSLMFGPAAAWGAAIGNTIADFFGTLGPGTIFGFVGNFLFGLIPYKIWRSLGKGVPIARSHRSTAKSAVIALVIGVVIVLVVGIIAYYTKFTERPVLYIALSFAAIVASAFLVLRFLSVRYFILILSASAACGVFIGWGVHIMGLFPFSALGNIIVLNNLLVAAILGPLLLPVLYPAVKQLGLLYTDVMEESELSKPRAWGSVLMIVVVIASLVAGNWIAVGGYKSGVLGSALATTRLFTTKLFSVDPEFQADLDNKEVPETLLQEFRSNEARLSGKFNVRVEEEGSMWMITDEKVSIIRSQPMYSVRKEDNRLNVYERDVKGRSGLGLALLPFILLTLIAAFVM